MTQALCIVGNKRSGSTHLMELLNIHPNIFIHLIQHWSLEVLKCLKGASAHAVTFDNTSLLSVDVTRARANIAEGRFVVQDGAQLWISEGALIQDETGEYLCAAQNGMETENYRSRLTTKPICSAN